MRMLKESSAVLLGIVLGTFTGLTPGIHVNLVSAVLLSFAHSSFSAIVIIAMAVTHTFLDALPSIFLGAPDSDHALSVLPGHKLLMDGLGFDAVRLTVIGSLCGLVLALALMPLLVFIFPTVYDQVQPWIGWLLILIITLLLLKEKAPAKICIAIVVFFLAGILGLIVLEHVKQPFFPLLSGLFGASTLLISLFNKQQTPVQLTNAFVRLDKKDYAAIPSSLLAGSFVALFPGLGSAQAAALSSLWTQVKSHSYLMLVGGINTVNFVVSMATLLALNRARNGALIAVNTLVEITTPSIMLFSAVALVAGGIATILALKLAKGFANLIEYVPYFWLSVGVLSFLLVLSFVFSGVLGIITIIVATAVGLIAPLTGVSRSHAMGCLLLPVILFYL